MLKKLYLFIAFLALPTFMHTHNRITVINATLEHITLTKTDIMFEMKLALILKEKNEEHFKNILSNTYVSVKTACLQLLGTITVSPEFKNTIEQVTTEQLQLIVEEQVHYNDIVIDPSFYPLEEKIKKELSLAGFDQQTEQIFNVFYVVYAIIHGSQILLKKLELKEKELIVELKALSAPNQSV